MFKQGYAPYLLYSGGTRWGKYNPPQSLQAREIAIKAGIPEDTFIVEAESNNTKENVVYSLRQLQRTIGLNKIRKIIGVSIPWHYRRCYLNMKTIFPDWIEFMWSSIDTDIHDRHNCDKNEQSRTCVYEELNKVIRYVRENKLKDMEIDI